MSERTCPHCRGHVEPGAERCRWCNAPLPMEVSTYRVGDLLRIRNPFKGGHVEEVTVAGIERGGHGMTVQDQRGQYWGLIKPTDVITVVKRGKGE